MRRPRKVPLRPQPSPHESVKYDGFGTVADALQCHFFDAPSLPEHDEFTGTPS